MCLKLDTYIFLGIHGLLSIFLCVDAVLRLNLKLKSGPVASIFGFVDFFGLRSGSFRLCSKSSSPNLLVDFNMGQFWQNVISLSCINL
jgi:hypothetical protein